MQDLISKNAARLELSIRLIDVLALESAGQFAGYLRFNSSLEELAPIHSVLLYFCGVLAFLLFARFGIYASWRGRSMLAINARMAAAWALVLLTGLFFSFLIHHAGELSRLWLFYWFFTGVAFIGMVRVVVFSALRYLRKNGMNSKRVIIVGYGRIGQEMHERALQQDWYGYDVKAIHADTKDGHRIDTSAVARINALEDIPDYIVDQQIDEVWIAISLSASDQLQRMQYLLRNALVDIRWIPDTFGMQMLSNKVGDFLGFPAVDLNRPISNGLNGFAKELFDKIFSAAVLIALLPLFIVIGVCIKLSSPGPVFFKQPRHGLNGKQFNVYKFRSMRLHPEDRQIAQATRDDPRITRFGQFLRRTSLDELPQFINVLLGDMSVVGPRPHALQHNEMYKEQLEIYMVRHRVKPGITGWAQIHGHRGETDTIDKMAKRVQFDLYYIQNWSLWMDIRIVMWTAFKGWTGSNAY
jgi:putative colanic acid biosynthesis UDP-glucose lipid carrier transferase